MAVERRGDGESGDRNAVSRTTGPRVGASLTRPKMREPLIDNSL